MYHVYILALYLIFGNPLHFCAIYLTSNTAMEVKKWNFEFFTEVRYWSSNTEEFLHFENLYQLVPVSTS